LIDENLSPSLELLAHERGFVCSHVNHLGKTGQKDSPVRDDDEGTAACHGYQINTFTLSTRLCLALHRYPLPVHCRPPLEKHRPLPA
jgi:hypothetical protein